MASQKFTTFLIEDIRVVPRVSFGISCSCNQARLPLCQFVYRHWAPRSAQHKGARLHCLQAGHLFMWAETTQTTAGHTRALNRSVFPVISSEDTVKWNACSGRGRSWGNTWCVFGKGDARRGDLEVCAHPHSWDCQASWVFVQRVPQYRCLCWVSSSHGKENPQLYFQCKVTAPCQALQAKCESGLPSELSSLTPLSKLRVVNTQVWNLNMTFQIPSWVSNELF